MKTAVVLACYNGEKYIVEQLDSLRLQTRVLDEILIVDDCSTDNTIQIVEEYIKQYELKNWRLVINSYNKGWCRNFIDAFGMVDADLIFPCDQDDIWSIDKVENMSVIMEENPQINVLVSNFEVFNMSASSDIPGVYKMINDGKVKPILYNSRYMTIRRPGCVYCFRRLIYPHVQKMWTEGQAHDSILWRVGIFTDSLYLYQKSTIKWRRTDTSTTIGKRNDWNTAYREYSGWIVQNKYFLENIEEDILRRNNKKINAKKCIRAAELVLQIHQTNSIVDRIKLLAYINVFASWKTAFKIMVKSNSWRKEEC